jgi:hypothetical protein
MTRPSHFHLPMADVWHFDLNGCMANVEAGFHQINRLLQNRLGISAIFNEQMAA